MVVQGRVWEVALQEKKGNGTTKVRFGALCKGRRKVVQIDRFK